MHEIQALIGSEAATFEILARWSAACRWPLLSFGHFIVPLDSALLRQMTLPWFEMPDLEESLDGDALARALSPIVGALGALDLPDPLALVLTQYWGGAGEQAALRIGGGAQSRPSIGRGAINGVLAGIGVRRTDPHGADEFDIVGLGRWRSTEAIASHRTRRAR